MKKLIALSLALIMVFALAACGGDEAPAESAAPAESEAPVESAAPAESDAPAEGGDDMAFTTAVEGQLTMATNAAFPPYEYYEGDSIVGIDAEIAAAIAEKLGLELVIDDMEFGSIINAVTTGKADVGLAGMTVTPEREESVNFSTSYATGVQVIIVKEGSAITTVDDLFDVGGYTIGVQMNTTGDLYTTWDLEDAGLATIDRYSRGADAVLALTTDKVDCVVIDNEPAKVFVEQNEGLMILETEYITEEYAIAMSKDNEALYNAVNGALDELIADGTVDAIIAKYITSE